jgi:hypothetical protein
MHGRKLLFIHALLGTLLIIAVQNAEEMAKQSHIALPWLKYILFFMIFLVLLVLDWFADFFQKKSGRHLTEVGGIEGCWLEKSRRAGEKIDHDLGAFITITYLVDKQSFRIEGEVFSPGGELYGHFEGHGRSDSLGTKLLYDYSADHGGQLDDGTGCFSFRQVNQKRATQFGGSFHGTGTKIVRVVDGSRTECIPAYIGGGDALINEKQKRVVDYLSKANGSSANTAATA